MTTYWPDSDSWTLTGKVESEGGAIAFQRTGAGPAVVLLHGTPWSSWTWRHLATSLADRFTVYVFDHLGFGQSDKQDGQDVSLAAHGRRFAKLLDAWGLERPALVAHDIGGAIALRALLLHGRRFAALALVDVVALAPWGSPFYRLVNAHEAVFAQVPAAIHRGIVRAYIATAQPNPFDSATERALTAPWLGPAGQAAFYRQIAHGNQRDTDDVERRYGEIDVPTIVLWGRRDPWLPVSQGAELARRIPNARLEVLPDAGHLAQLDAPSRVDELICEHLKRTPAADN